MRLYSIITIFLCSLTISSIIVAGKNETKTANKELKEQIIILEKKNKKSLQKGEFFERFLDGNYTYRETDKKEKKIFLECAYAAFGTILQKDNTLVPKLPKGLPSRKQRHEINKLFDAESKAITANLEEMTKIAKQK